jgi:hypothetical protein
MMQQSDLAEASPARPWPAERIEHWPIGRLMPYANNTRLHSEADLDKVADSMRRFWVAPAELLEPLLSLLLCLLSSGRWTP